MKAGVRFVAYLVLSTLHRDAGWRHINSQARSSFAFQVTRAAPTCCMSGQWSWVVGGRRGSCGVYIESTIKERLVPHVALEALRGDAALCRGECLIPRTLRVQFTGDIA
jgi:hypothetical protein